MPNTIITSVNPGLISVESVVINLRIQFFKHIHAWILSVFKHDRLFVIRSPPPEKMRSTGTLVPIYKRNYI